MLSDNLALEAKETFERADSACALAKETLLSVRVTLLAKDKPLPIINFACATLTLLAETVDTPAAIRALVSDEVKPDQSEELIVSAGDPPPNALKVIAPPVAFDKVSKLDKLSFSPAARVTSILASVCGTKISLAAVLNALAKLL